MPRIRTASGRVLSHSLASVLWAEDEQGALNENTLTVFVALGHRRSSDPSKRNYKYIPTH